MREKRNNSQKDVKTSVRESLIVEAFRGYARELDAKHDRRERLVKISRDVTIESKRIIFYLHSLIKEEDKEEGLRQAENRIHALVQGPLRKAALEMDGSREGWQPLSGCLQEMAEALCLWHFMKHPSEHSLPDWRQLAQLLSDDQEVMREFLSMLSPLELVLGVADYTGELMRQCVGCAPLGELNTCYAIRDILQQLYVHFIGLHRVFSKDMSQKIHTLKCSVLKIELVCFDLKLRGSHKFLIRDDYYNTHKMDADTDV